MRQHKETSEGLRLWSSERPGRQPWREIWLGELYMETSGSEEEGSWEESRKAAWRKGHQGLAEAQVGFQSIRVTV